MYGNGQILNLNVNSFDYINMQGVNIFTKHPFLTACTCRYTAQKYL